MPYFYQTHNNTIGYATNGSSYFTRLWRAKHKKDRLQICNLAKAIYCNGNSGIKYSMGAGGVLSKMGNIKGYAARVKAGMKRKFKGKSTDCSHFVAACAFGAGVPYGGGDHYLNSDDLVKADSLKNFTKHDAQKAFTEGTFQRGDIVAYKKGHNGASVGHVAIVAHDGKSAKHVFDGYMADGSKKPTSTKKIKQAVKDNKKSKKKINKMTKAQLKAYYKQLKKDYDNVVDKINSEKRKEQTAQRKKYIDKLKDLKKDLKNKKKAVKKKIDNYKSDKSRPNSSSSSSSNSGGFEDYEGWDENENEDGEDPDETESDPDEKEPEPVPESVDYYFIRSGPNHFSNNGLYKDYVGNILCKRKLKIPTIVTTIDSWTLTFDMPFTSCAEHSNNILSAQKMSSEKEWKIIIQKPTSSYEDYWIDFKTSLNVVYHILFQIEAESE